MWQFWLQFRVYARFFVSPAHWPLSRQMTSAIKAMVEELQMTGEVAAVAEEEKQSHIGNRRA